MLKITSDMTSDQVEKAVFDGLGLLALRPIAAVVINQDSIQSNLYMLSAKNLATMIFYSLIKGSEKGWHAMVDVTNIGVVCAFFGNKDEIVFPEILSQSVKGTC